MIGIIVMLIVLYLLYKFFLRPIIVRLWDVRDQDLFELFKRKK